MKAPHLKTTSSATELVAPDIERDAPLGVEWLHGEAGRNTLALMGVADKDNKPTTIEAEKQRVQGFIEGTDQLNWMIQHEGKIVGSVWVDLVTHEGLPAPSVHIMIGDPAQRGKGVGFLAFRSVLDYLEAQGYRTIYSRHLTKNNAAKALLDSFGFRDLDAPYVDDDGLAWQNAIRTTTTTN